ncbi:hypothetical protein SAMN04488122_5245 [Chitinophaga arvensicola]|uniref:Uncharacterized protein n=1 Tax=Chitinophaga arvensicola TaxID=29529 RepID=A0A1I0SBU1_9BACT|nr:hypothetical protein SAMN04488122_5245 [Chitinophaga arvensicola]
MAFFIKINEGRKHNSIAPLIYILNCYKFPTTIPPYCNGIRQMLKNSIGSKNMNILVEIAGEKKKQASTKHQCLMTRIWFTVSIDTSFSSFKNGSY